MDGTVEVHGPDGNVYHFPASTTKEQAIAYFKKKGIRASKQLPPLTEAQKQTLGQQSKKTTYDLASGRKGTLSDDTSRAVGEFAGGITDVAKGIGGLVTPPETKAEKVLDLIPGALPVKRMAEGMVAPLKSLPQVPGAVRDIAKSGYALPALADSGPRAGGQAVAMEAAGRVGKELPRISDAVEGVKSLKEVPGRVVRSYTGADARTATEATTKALDTYAAKAEKVAAKNAEKAEAHATKLQEAAEKQARVEKKAADINAERKAEFEKKQAQQAEDVAKRERAHAEEVQAVTELNDAIAEKQGQRAVAAQRVDAVSRELGDDLKRVKQKIHDEGVGKYEAVKAAMRDSNGNPIAIPADNVIAAIRKAEIEDIKGSPENVKQFRELLKRGSAEPVQTSVGTLAPNDPLYRALVEQGAIEVPAGITFDDLQGYYTELGGKMWSDSVPTDVSRAMQHVREAIGKEMQTMADQRGVGPKLSDAQNFWREYSKVFQDERAVTNGGSPVANALKAVDPKTIAKRLTGDAAERSLEYVKKYDLSLGRKIQQMQHDWETVKRLKAPASAKPKSLPKPPEAPRPIEPPKQVIAPKLTPPKAPTPLPRPELPDLAKAVEEAKAGKAHSLASSLRRLSGWDLASFVEGIRELGQGQIPVGFSLTVLRHGLGYMLDNPKVVEWLSKPTAEDFATIDRVLKNHPYHKQIVQNGLADVYLHQASKGTNLPMTPEVVEFLNRNQVKRIIAAQAAGASQNKQLPPISPRPSQLPPIEP